MVYVIVAGADVVFLWPTGTYGDCRYVTKYTPFARQTYLGSMQLQDPNESSDMLVWYEPCQSLSWLLQAMLENKLKDFGLQTHKNLKNRKQTNAS
jgi:hypothetical protein